MDKLDRIEQILLEAINLADVIWPDCDRRQKRDCALLGVELDDALEVVRRLRPVFAKAE